MAILMRFFVLVLLLFSAATVLKFTHDYIYAKGYQKYEEQLVIAVRSGRAINMGKVTVATGVRGENLIFVVEGKNGD